MEQGGGGGAAGDGPDLGLEVQKPHGHAEDSGSPEGMRSGGSTEGRRAR